MTTFIKEFDKVNLKTVRADLDAALLAVAQKHGLKLSIGGITYTANTLTTKITGTTRFTSGTGTAQEVPGNAKWQAAFIKNAFVLGMKKEDLGKKFKYGTETVTLVGARPKANMPIVVMNSKGKMLATYASVLKAV
jgi:hypothetical protein